MDNLGIRLDAGERLDEEAVVQVVNLGKDADTAGSVVGALAGAAYGLAAVPRAWQQSLSGQWPVHSGVGWDTARLIALADRLAHTALSS